MLVGSSVVFDGAGTPLRISRMSVPDPGPDELLVRVVMAGVCGTDVHRLAGDVVGAGHPICFGHEGVGEVVALGADLTADGAGQRLAVGDRVYWFPPTPCQRCATCRAGAPLACENLDWPVRADRPNRAAFQEFALIPRRTAFHRIPDGTATESVVAFGCAMPTAIGGFERLGAVPEDVVIQGAGPVGLACVVLAVLGGAKRVVVIGDPAGRLETARRLGATEVIPLTGTTRAERADHVRRALGGGAAAVIEAAGHPSAFPEGFDMLGHGGRFLIMGLYSGTDASALIDPVRINNLNLKIIGTSGMATTAFAQTIDIATEHGARLGFSDLVTHRYPLDETGAAIAAVGRGEPVKAVVVP